MTVTHALIDEPYALAAQAAVALRSELRVDRHDVLLPAFGAGRPVLVSTT